MTIKQVTFYVKWLNYLLKIKIKPKFKYICINNIMKLATTTRQGVVSVKGVF